MPSYLSISGAFLTTADPTQVGGLPVGTPLIPFNPGDKYVANDFLVFYGGFLAAQPGENLLSNLNINAPAITSSKSSPVTIISVLEGITMWMVVYNSNDISAGNGYTFQITTSVANDPPVPPTFSFIS